MIDALLEKANGAPAYVFVSSAKDSLIPPALKVEFLTKMLTRGGVFPKNLTLVNTATCATPCGGPLGGWEFLKGKGLTGPDVLLVVGGDQRNKFDPKTAGMWSTIDSAQRPSIFSLERSGPGAATFSSTKAREQLELSGAAGLKPFLTDGSNAVTDADVARMAATLLAVKDKWSKKKTGGGDEDLSAFDEDLDGGRRRKTRRKSRSMRKKRISIHKRR
jgi:hypothetical protein